MANCRSSSSPSRAREIRNAVEFCDKQKIKMILAGGAEAYKVKELLRSKNIPVILQPTLTEPLNEDDPYDRSLTNPPNSPTPTLNSLSAASTIPSRAASASKPPTP